MCVLGSVWPGDFFGETALLESRERRAASVVCLERTEVLMLDRNVVSDIANDKSKMSDNIRERVDARQRERLTKVLESLYISLKQRQRYPKGTVAH